MVTIHFSTYGNNLGTRILGRKIAPEIKYVINSNNKVTFDWSGVEIVSLSFTDELFGLLIDDIGFDTFKAKTHFINYNPDVKSIISVAIGMHKRPNEVN